VTVDRGSGYEVALLCPSMTSAGRGVKITGTRLKRVSVSYKL
jgi:hypothetical protein